MPAIDTFLITCEHGGNQVPEDCRDLLQGRQRLLDSHRGHDAGALQMARALATAFHAPLVAGTVSRLLIDLNRPAGHPQLHSAVMRHAPAARRAALLAQVHQPHWAQVERLVHQAVARSRRVIHIGAHSYTPVLQGQVRRADVGLLYDPARPGEAALCARWKQALANAAPGLRVRRNYPYQGRAAGLTAQLRHHFPPEAYVGIELEINQRIIRAAGPRWTALRGTLIATLRAASAA